MNHETTTETNDEVMVTDAKIDLNCDFLCEIDRCDEKSEYENMKNEINENIDTSSDSGFCSSDAEDSVTNDDEGSTCSLDELFVEEVEDLKTKTVSRASWKIMMEILGYSPNRISKNGNGRKRYC